MRTYIKRWKIDIYNQISKNEIVFNLGACRGKDTSVFSEQASEGLVVAVEPIFENYIHLVQRIANEGQKNVIPILAGIGNKTGQSKIYLDEEYPVGHSSVRLKRFPKNSPTRRILTISWDDLVAMMAIERVDFAKIDVNGAEIKAFEGMTRVFPERMLVEDSTENNAFPHQGNTEMKNRLRYLLKERKYKIIEEVGYYLYVKR